MLAAHANANADAGADASSTGNEDRRGERKKQRKCTVAGNARDDKNGSAPSTAARKSGLPRSDTNGKAVTDHRHGYGRAGGGILRGRGPGAGGVDGVEPGADEATPPTHTEEKKAAVIRAQMSVLMVGLYEIIRQVGVTVARKM